MRTLLRLRAVDACYGRLRALAGVSLVVPEGAVVALLGPNGAGKSTLLRTVSGVVAPTAGEILLDGRRIDGLAEHEVARLGVTHLPEGRGIFPSLTVRENLRMAVRATRGGALDSVFETFPALASRLSQSAGTLSGGEQQMLALARALTKGPRLLMADELSLGLAPRVVSELFGVLRRVRDRGATILLVEQYVRQALRLADIVVVLHKGCVRFIGEPGELARDETLVASYLGHGAAAAVGPA